MMSRETTSLSAEVVKEVVNAPDVERARTGRDLVLGALVVKAGVTLAKEYMKSRTSNRVWVEEEQALTPE